MLKGDDLPFGLCALSIAPIAFFRGFIDAEGGLPGIFWGLSLVMGFQFFCNLPSGLLFSVIKAYLKKKHAKIHMLVNSAYILLAVFLAIGTPINFYGGDECTGMEIEDRWGTVRCFNPVD